MNLLIEFGSLPGVKVTTYLLICRYRNGDMSLKLRSRRLGYEGRDVCGYDDDGDCQFVVDLNIEEVFSWTGHNSLTLAHRYLQRIHHHGLTSKEESTSHDGEDYRDST